ncbi:hypothetical protein AWC38_SpisGene18824 [Paramuricea clavata]|uniref:Peptidase A2 domain-containing protein n=1 Tax=Paramuricea clavata TaxID=317549 RepID=A0A7D9D867_PARCT|nr:hypothetical protein AWC38_SpisGene18824 [Paramuricea clavata]
MCADDRKVWSRDLKKDTKTASLHGLMTWMNVEMKSRMRAFAPLRTITTDQEALLPVISVNIDGENNLYKRGNILLDSGAQLSLIRQETAETPGLEGDNISITLTKVGGEEEEIRTKVYKVQVSPPDSNKRFVIKAVGIPTISDDIAEMKTKEIAKQLGLKDKIYRGKGPVDILIGIDHPSITKQV